MNLNSLFFTIDEEKLLLDESSIDHFEGINHSKKPNSTSIKKIFKNLFNRSKTIKQYDSRDGRHINFTDEISRQIIISIFPRQIKHYTKEEILTDIDFLSFLETHFCLNTGYTTPRIIIMFVEKCLSLVKEYYRNNPDISVELENNEYPLIKRDLILKAYSDFKNELLVVFSKISHKWERWFNSLRTKRGNKYSFSYNDIRRLLQIQDKDLEEQTSFLAFLDHIGYIKCENPFSLPYKRKYKLPILFR